MRSWQKSRSSQNNLNMFRFSKIYWVLSQTNYLCNKLPVNIIYIMMIMMTIVIRSPTIMIIIHDDRQETALDGATSRRSSCFTPRAKVLPILNFYHDYDFYEAKRLQMGLMMI